MNGHRSEESVLDPVHAPLPMTTEVPPSRSENDIKASFLNEEKQFVTEPKKAIITDQPYLKGYVVIYSKVIPFGKNDAEWSLNDYDGQLSIPMAEFVEEVETVVLRNCQQRKGLDYKIEAMKKTVPSYNWSCDLTIIDRTIPAVIHRKKFSSSVADTFLMLDPDIDKYETNIPNTEMKEFLNGLPLK